MFRVFVVGVFGLVVCIVGVFVGYVIVCLLVDDDSPGG